MSTTYTGQGLHQTTGYGAMPTLTASQLVQGLSGITGSQNPKERNMNLPGISFKLTTAIGGTIVSVTDYTQRENTITLSGFEKETLYVIPENVKNFDRELGKIITLHRLKQDHE
jgi:hypothetical protein